MPKDHRPEAADEDPYDDPDENPEATVDADDPGVRRTTDHTMIRSVIESRGGYPARVPETGEQGDRGLLRVGDRDRGEDLEELSWETFFEAFDEKGLVFVYPADGDDLDRVALRSEDAA